MQVVITMGYRSAALSAIIVGSAVFGISEPVLSDTVAQCAERLETTRLWIRATDPEGPDADRQKVEKAINDTYAVCEAARKRQPEDGKTLVNAAYARFSLGERAAGQMLIKQAADGGYPPAMVMMARFLGNGDGFDKDVEGAWLMLLKVLDSDHVGARIEAALEFLPGGAGPENPKRTATSLQEMIDVGSGEAMVAYAMRVLDLLKAKRDSEAAVDGLALLERAAREAQDGTAMFYLSVLYNEGRLVERDPDRAVEFAQMAIDAGHRRGYGIMGQVFQSEEEQETAVSWFRRGAEAGDGFSQGMLGFMYSGGFGVEQDMEKAVYWWNQGRWNGDRMSTSYLKVHREAELARAEAKQNQETEPDSKQD